MRDWPSIAVRFPACDESLADLFSASLDAGTVAAIEERSPTEWLVSFRDSDARNAACLNLRDAFEPLGVTLKAIDVSDEDWARRSQASLGSVRAGRFLVVPPWLDESGEEAADTIRLVIEPSMGFGSGHHATTRLCLTALQNLPVPGARVIDIGTGSGILAIAASLLGAACVRGIDNDPDALASARADADMNAVGDRILFDEGDFRGGALGEHDIVLANLTGGMLAASAADIVAAARRAGHLILSGITTAEAQSVLDAFAPLTTLVWRGDEDGWVGLVLTRD
jgi:ribosomal protein L11 methyltransferase